MKSASRIPALALFTLAVLAAPLASAQLKITEAMSSSNSTVDWFELTNFGGSAVNVTGFKVDDNSFSFAASLALNGVTSIAPGESVVFLETAAPSTAISSFRTFWGNISAIQIGNYSGSMVGLSSGGDGLTVFTSGGALAVATNVSFGAATTGTSFGYNTTSGTFGGLSQTGLFGAFVSDGAAHDLGSPGSVGAAVPEPSTTALILGAGTLAGLVVLRRRK